MGFAFRPASAALLPIVANTASVPAAGRITEVSPAAGVDGAATRPRDRPAPQAAAAAARDIAALRAEMERLGQPPGPPPAFRLNLLDAETGLARALARIEVRHALAGSADAMAPPPARPPGTPHPLARSL